MNNEICELKLEELEQVNGGAILDRIIAAYLNAVGKNLMDAIHQPIVQPKTISLHMR